jgi:hypothetical protein
MRPEDSMKRRNVDAIERNTSLKFEAAAIETNPTKATAGS